MWCHGRSTTEQRVGHEGLGETMKKIEIGLRAPDFSLPGVDGKDYSLGAFKNKKSLAEALAGELILAASKDPMSYAIKKKVELERIARSAR